MGNGLDLAQHLDLTARDLLEQFFYELEMDLNCGDPSWLQRGNGTLTIDLRAGAASHEGRAIPDLKVGQILWSWLRESLVNAGLPKTGATNATVVAHMRFDRYREQRDPDTLYDVVPVSFVGCSVEAHSKLAVQGARASARQTRTFEYPDPEAIR